MKRPRPSGGFTIILAIALLGIIAVAVAMIVHQLGYELRRTRTAYEDAQLRQLLLAAAQEIAMNSDSSTTQPFTTTRQIELPPALTSQGASILISQGKAQDSILVIANLAGREASQTLRFDRQSRHWAVSEPAE